MVPDLTLCGGEGCPLRSACYRFRAVAHGRRDSFASPPWDPVAAACEHREPLPVVTEDQVRTRAFALWSEQGRPEGKADEHWLLAEAELVAALAARLRPVP